jgi:hypothetical protein
MSFPISLSWLPNFRRRADAIFTVSSGNREKILSILRAGSKLYAKSG